MKKACLTTRSSLKKCRSRAQFLKAAIGFSRRKGGGTVYSSVAAARRAGNFRLTIHPYPSTVTHGRGRFFTHGGSNPGSAGCIDLTVYMDKFVENLKQELEGLPECYVALNADYSKKK